MTSIANCPRRTVYVYDNDFDRRRPPRLPDEARGRPSAASRASGKGNVCRQMFRDIDADCYLMVDGDDTYPAEAAASPMRSRFSTGEADMVVGDRLSNGDLCTRQNRRAPSTASATTWCAP